MIVVSDTTPLCYLAVLGCLDFLPRLFGTVHCPETVIEECRHLHAPERLRQWIANLPAWLVVESDVGDIEPALQKALDAGEAAAIALAQRLRAQVVLMDERDGRKCALERGFVVAGTLNILAQAGRRGWCDYGATVARLKHALRLVLGPAQRGMKGTEHHVQWSLHDFTDEQIRARMEFRAFEAGGLSSKRATTRADHQLIRTS